MIKYQGHDWMRLGDSLMDENNFNMAIRKYLKKVGVTSQREIEQAVKNGVDGGTLLGSEILLNFLARFYFSSKFSGISKRCFIFINKSAGILDRWRPIF